MTFAMRNMLTALHLIPTQQKQRRRALHQTLPQMPPPPRRIDGSWRFAAGPISSRTTSSAASARRVGHASSLRAAGLVVDSIKFSGAREAQEGAIVNKGFGKKGHVFQYLWAHGHLPRPSEPWPQKGKARLSLG